MTEYDNRNGGVLFKNKRKNSEKHPDYTGTWTDDNDQEWWLSAWVRESQKTGQKFMSLKASPKDPQQAEENHDQSTDADPF